jgi:hypothetical protein
MTAKRFYQCSAAAAVAAAMAIASAPAPAQTTEETKAHTEQLKAQAELERARADNARAAAERISALGLPSFEGRTTLNQGAGSIEATMLASYAVDAAAVRISERVKASHNRTGTSPDIIVLAGDEALDFGRVGAMDTELNALSDVFAQLGFPAPPPGPQTSGADKSLEAGGSASAVIAAATAAAGLLRSNTEVTALDLQAISNRALATAVAARLDSAVLPSAAIGRLDDAPQSATGWSGMSLFQKYTNLLERRRQINVERGPAPVEPAKPTERYKELSAGLTRFDAAAARITTPDASGAVPLAQAMRLEAMSRGNPRVLRVYVDRAGGSLVNRTNLLTTLGMADPVRVSGGMFVSYTLTDPASGRVLSAEVITCRTTSTRLSSVQRGVWGNRVAGRRAQEGTCTGRA